MDQFVSSLAQAGSTLLIDCRSKEFETVPLTDDGVLIVVANSGVKHKHAEGAYGKRVEECRQAVKAVSFVPIITCPDLSCHGACPILFSMPNWRVSVCTSAFVS